MPSSEETTATTRAFLTDHPEAEESLAALIEHDDRDEPWTFDEIELDSGLFGELVSRDLAIGVNDGYRLQNPDAIRAALNMDSEESNTPRLTPKSNTTSSPTDPNEYTSITRLTSQLPPVVGVSLRTFFGLVGVLLVVIAARLVAAPAVLRDGFVVSPANDTYFFRYWQERLAARAQGIFDIGVFAEMGGASTARPLAHATNLWVTVLFGGVDAAPLVTAGLPIVASVVLGYVVYRLTNLLTRDIRIALAAVLFYGLAPANVVYTSVGFLDHQAHQYLWLGFLVLAITALGADVARRTHETAPTVAAHAHARAPTSWIIAGVLAITVAASAHAWGGSPLTFVPVAAVVGLRVVLDVHHDVSPVAGNAPLVGGLAAGAGLTLTAHIALGWHETIAAVTPLLVVGGAIISVIIGEAWRHTSFPAISLIGVEAAVAGGGLLVYSTTRPQDIARIRTRATDLFFRESISETVSLFSPDFAVVFGPLLQLGLGFYFGIAVLMASTWVLTRRYEPGWLVLVCFAWYYILLATIQVRFAGQLAIFIAPFAGIGLLYLLAAIDIARPVTILGRDELNVDSIPTGRLGHSTGTDDSGSPSDWRADNDRSPKIRTLQIPEKTRIRGYLVATVTLVLLFNLILVPPFVGQATHDPAQFEAAQAIDAHADSADRDYPDNFVLSQWGNNRMYNYFVSGESRSYSYAQSNYEPFLADDDPDTWYNQFQGRVGYVVLTDREEGSRTNTAYAALYDGLGIGVNRTATTGHYQLLTTDNGIRTFAVVPGATLRVPGQSGDQITATTTVTVENKSYPYTRSATVSEETAVIRVAHPGEYTVNNQTVTVSTDAVSTGTQLNVSSS